MRVAVFFAMRGRVLFLRRAQSIAKVAVPLICVTHMGVSRFVRRPNVPHGDRLLKKKKNPKLVTSNFLPDRQPLSTQGLLYCLHLHINIMTMFFFIQLPPRCCVAISGLAHGGRGKYTKLVNFVDINPNTTCCLLLPKATKVNIRKTLRQHATLGKAAIAIFIFQYFFPNKFFLGGSCGARLTG